MGYVATGITADDLKSAAQTALDAGSAAKNILSDPSLRKVVTLINEAYQIDKASGVSTSSSGGSSTGLSDLVFPLEVYVQAKRHPVLKAAIPIALIGIPLYLGYLIGKR